MQRRFYDDGPPLPFSPSRVRWLKAINKVRVQLREVRRVLFILLFSAVLCHTCTNVQFWLSLTSSVGSCKNPFCSLEFSYLKCPPFTAAVPQSHLWYLYQPSCRLLWRFCEMGGLSTVNEDIEVNYSTNTRKRCSLNAPEAAEQLEMSLSSRRS